MSLELPTPPRSRSPIATWLVAGCLAAMLHAGAVAAFVRVTAPDPDDDELGADAIEIGVELASPKQEQADLPPGPDSEAAAASTASVKQTAAPEKVDLPEEKPVESEDPDRVITEQRSEQPKEAEQKPKPEQTEQSAESAAAEATAAPSVEVAREAPVSTAPSPGSGASANRIKATWQRQLVAHLNRNKRYPAGGARRDVQIVVNFTIDRTGHLKRADIAKSSGDASFDQAALAMLQRADPLPMPPPLTADDGLTFALPVIFKANVRS